MAEKQQTELIIKEAAKEIFVRKGYSGARMQDIADEAGINKALLHYYYRSKEKLFDVIFTEIFNSLIGQLADGLKGTQDLFVKIELFIDTYITVLEKNPYLPLFILNEISQNPDRFVDKVKKMDSFSEAANMAGLMLQAMEEGKIRAFHPFHLFMNIISLSIFPFIAKPMFKTVGGIDEETWKTLMQTRKEEVKRFIFNAITIK